MLTLTAKVTNGSLDWPGGSLIGNKPNVPAHGTITVKVPEAGEYYQLSYWDHFLIGPRRLAWNTRGFKYKYVKLGDSIPKVPPFRPMIDKK